MQNTPAHTIIARVSQTSNKKVTLVTQDVKKKYTQLTQQKISLVPRKEVIYKAHFNFHSLLAKIRRI